MTMLIRALGGFWRLIKRRKLDEYTGQRMLSLKMSGYFPKRLENGVSVIL